jgi:hypothetical protein
MEPYQQYRTLCSTPNFVRASERQAANLDSLTLEDLVHISFPAFLQHFNCIIDGLVMIWDHPAEYSARRNAITGFNETLLESEGMP